MRIDAELFCKRIDQRHDNAETERIDDHDQNQYPYVSVVLHSVKCTAKIQC